jgi:hypothetical protein
LSPAQEPHAADDPPVPLGSVSSSLQLGTTTSSATIQIAFHRSAIPAPFLCLDGDCLVPVGTVQR